MRANIQPMLPKTIKPQTHMKHIEVQPPPPDGLAWMLAKRCYDASNIGGSVYGLDGWRTPDAPKKGRLHRLQDAPLRPCHI